MASPRVGSAKIYFPLKLASADTRLLPVLLASTPLTADHPYGAWSLAPSLVAIALALMTRRVVLSLFVGICVGGLLLVDGHLAWAVGIVFEGHLWASLIEPNHIRVFAFTLLMGAMIGVIRGTGGMQEVVAKFTRLAHTRRRGQVVTCVLGLLVFFDDYANTLLLGTTMRSLTDRLGISREKLAYLVDSTAAPVAGLALVSTWVAGEIGYIEAGLEGLDFSDDVPSGMMLFVASIPYRFYVIWTLIWVGLIAFTGWDFGPMWKAEQRAACRSKPPHTGSNGNALIPRESKHDSWIDAVFPIAATLSTIVFLLAWTGRLTLLDVDASERSWFQMVVSGDSYLALTYGSLVGLCVAIVIAKRHSKRIRNSDLYGFATEGALEMLPALAILWLAWTISGMTEPKNLATGQYLSSIIVGTVTSPWMPSVVFLLAAATSFTTGSSWGTMGLLMPLVVPTVHQMLLEENGAVISSEPIFIATIGSVLAGAIFGDHCSPISDTTVLSSQATGCDHASHVTTQMPYALVVAALAIAVGTIPIGCGFSVWIALPLGIGASLVLMFVLGRSVKSSPDCS